MTATVTIEEANGAGPVWSSLTGITGRYCTEDSYNPLTSNPCKVPASDFNYSFWKTHRAKFTGTFNSIRNIYWYCDGNVADDWDLGTSGILQIGTRTSGDNGLPLDVVLHGSNAYEVAGGTTGTTGYNMDDGTNGHDYYNGVSGAVVDADNYTSSAPLLIDSNQYTASGNYSKAWVTQLKIASNAVQGDKVTKTFVVMYDEY